MPFVILDRLPLPSLKTYTIISVALLSSSLFYAHQTVTNGIRSNETVVPYVQENNGIETQSDDNFFESSAYVLVYLASMLHIMVTEPWCVWTGVNMAYCSLILLGKIVQKIIFGELRVSEQQHIKDKFWNFVFYKFIFIFGILNLQYMDEVVLWCAWFSVLCFLQLLTQLCKDRFEYLSFSPTSTRPTQGKLILLLASIFLIAIFLLFLCIYISSHIGINRFAFMAAECILLLVRTMYVMTRYAIHLYDLNMDGMWENRGTYIYYNELVFELVSLCIDFVHHIHMLIWSNIFLSMASLVIGMQLRYLFHEIQRRVNRHKNYLRVLKHMEENYPMANNSELDDSNDNCAVCWDRMEMARRLPCGHMFHNSCLRSWLEQDTTCPTCRKSLSNPREAARLDEREEEEMNNADDSIDNNHRGQQTNHFFHFDGSRYFSWFPSVVVEVTHPPLLGGAVPLAAGANTSQLDTMARQVQEMFPHIPLTVIQDDLRTTRSMELTVHNVLDGNIVIPLTTSSSTATTSTLSEPSLYRSLSNPHPSSLIDYESAPSMSNLPSTQYEEASDADVLSTSKSDDTSTSSTIGGGSRFSKSPMERENILQRRREDLYTTARQNFLAKHPSVECLLRGETSSSSSNLRRRRSGDESDDDNDT